MMITVANPRLPSVTAQNVGRDLYHKRQDVAQIIGDEHSLKAIVWIFQRVPDMFDIQFYPTFIIIRRVEKMEVCDELQIA